jgi:hypothetical protein
MYPSNFSGCFLCGKEGHFKANCPQKTDAPKTMPTFTNWKTSNRVNVWFAKDRLCLDEYWEKDDLYSREQFGCNAQKLLEFHQADDPCALPLGRAMANFLGGTESERKGSVRALQSCVAQFVATKTR